MTRYLLIIIFSALSLIGCQTYQGNPYPQDDLVKETWMSQLETNPRTWMQGADRWFLTGDPNATEIADRNAPYSAAISTMMVQVPDFTSVEVDGAFEVQIFGTYDHNSVFLYGPNDGVRNVSVDMVNGKLCITQAKGANSRTMGRVIVRIGMSHLTNLMQRGCGKIEVIQMRSSGLNIISSGSGDIYLAGNVSLRKIKKVGSGSINVFGANTSSLEIYSQSPAGNVNVSGSVGVKYIENLDRGCINVIGATPQNPLSVTASGIGRVGITGFVNLKNIQAKNRAQIYIKQVNGGSVANVYTFDTARVGLAGVIGDLYVYSTNSSRFEGRYLCAQNAFVRATDYAHINVSSSGKLFASATKNATVYFFGTPNMMSQFVSGNGVVIPIWPNNYRRCDAPQTVGIHAATFKD